MLANPFALVALLAYVASCTVLLMYRKDGARHRHGVSFLAWVLLVMLGGSVIELALHHQAVGFFDAGRAVLLALFIYGARGNVARLLRSH